MANYFVCDFYIPKAKLAIEINGRNHFFPYSSRFNQFTNNKHKLLIANGHNIMHLNSWTLEGLNKESIKLDDLLNKTITTYTNQQTQ